MASGLTDEGLVIEAIDDIRTGMETDLRESFFQSLPLGDTTLLGHIVGILANNLGLLWERLEQVNSSQDPDKATGAALEALSVLTGTFRQPATKSTVTLTLCGTPSTTIAAGAVVATASTAKLFDTRDTVTTELLDDWVGSPPATYTVGDRVTNVGRCYQCITAGVTAGGTGPTTTDADITDNTVHWEYIGEGTAVVDVAADAEETGPVAATALDLSSIQTPVSGWETAFNLEDAVPGTNKNTDEELRLVRALELAGSGSTTRDSTKALLLKITNVTSAHVFVNDTDVTDGDGMPPHSFEAMVRGGDDQEIVDIVANNQPEGIQTYGNTSGTHVDSEGTSITVYYSRPVEIPIYVIVDVIKDPGNYPADGDDQIAEAIVAWGNAQVAGKDVVASGISARAFEIDGVLDVTSCKIGLAPGPTLSTTISITPRQLALYAETRVTVNSTNGVP